MTSAEFYLYDLKTKFKKINPKEYYLSYSGGKDSHLLYWFIKEYAPEFKDIKIVGINTYMEHPEIRTRIYDNCDEVLMPVLKPMEIKEKYGIPCFSKEQDFYIYYYQKAIREGREPAKTYQDKKFTPIWDLSDELLDEIYKEYNIEIPKVYDYVERTGCMGCPYGSWKGDTQKELALINDNQKKFVCEYFKESYDVLGVKYK